MDYEPDTTIKSASLKMIGLFALFSLYGLLLLSGVWLSACLELRSFLGKLLMAVTFAAAQLLLSIQLLSLFYQLNGIALLLLNACFTLLVGIGTSALKRSRFTLKSYHTLGEKITEIVSLAKQYSHESIVLGATFVVIAWFVALAFMMLPMTDTYHFGMPLFWKQHATIFPYPVANPRLISVVFASEALCFPGQLYLQTNAIFPILSGIAAMITIWVVISLAMQLGASRRAATYTGVTLVGYGVLIAGLTGGSPDVLVAAMWFAASLYFLLESRLLGTLCPSLLGCSVFCLLMACGTKNVVVLQLPAYVLGASLLLGRDLVKFRVVKTVALWGAAGIVSSSVLWSYTSNLIWFGTPRGHQVVSETVSKDMRPVAVWTRISRMTVAAFLDPVWVPSSSAQRYKDSIKQVVNWLGGQEKLPEDKGEYYSFTDKNLSPGKGLGFLGLLVLAPGVLTGAGMCYRRSRRHAKSSSTEHAFAALLVIAVGSFLTYYALLRWQPPGITRMMLSCLVAVVPLYSVLLERSKWRIISMIIVLSTVALFSVHSIGLVARRLQISPTLKIAQLLSRIQRDHAVRVKYQWLGSEVSVFDIRESYSGREIYQLFLSRVPRSESIGVIGGTNTDEYFIFGEEFSHKLVPLIDCRFPEQFLSIPADVNYVVVHDFDANSLISSIYPDFDLWLKVQKDDKTILAGLRRKNTGTSSISTQGREPIPAFLRALNDAEKLP